MPVFGFNTDIKVGATVFHVQTEDRGSANPVLNTTIYVKGRVLAKRATSYQDFLASPDFNESELQAMLERQHKQLIEEIRAGALPELAELETPPEVSGISVQLLNPATFLKGTTATLQLRVKKRQAEDPVAGAAVKVWLHTGTPQPYEFSGEVDEEGKTELQFHMPRLGPGGAQLQIQATSPEGQDEIRYTLRPRPKGSE
jgi:hypothetical protein